MRKKKSSVKQRMMNRAVHRIKNLEKKADVAREEYRDKLGELCGEIQEQRQIIKALGGKRSKEYKAAMKS